MKNQASSRRCHSTIAPASSITADDGAAGQAGLTIGLFWWPIAFARAIVYSCSRCEPSAVSAIANSQLPNTALWKSEVGGWELTAIAL
jgi:hypothetical protein